MKSLFFSIILSLVALSAIAQTNARHIDPNDPNRDPNWDWTPVGPGYTVYFATQTGIQTVNNVQVPFYTQGHSLADAATNDKKDMWKEDGWMLAYKDFGTSSIAPPLPFFVLYNKYRGIMRVMIYNARESLSSSFLMTLSFRSTSPRAPLFTMTNNSYNTKGAFYDGANPNQVESVIGKVHQLSDWFWADFVVAGYDPALPANSVLHLDLSLVDESKISLKSTKFTLDQVMSNSSVSNSKGNLVNQTIGAVDEGNRYFKTVDNVRSKFKETADRNKGEPWLKTALGAIANSGAASIVPVLSGALGFVNYFIGGKNKAAPQEPMSFKGVLEMDGMITITRPLVSYDFALTTTIPELPDYYKPVQNIPWGIINIKYPYTYTDIHEYVEPYYECVQPDPSTCGIYDEYGNYIPCVEDCHWVDNSAIGRHFHVVNHYSNPNTGMTLSSIKVSFVSVVRQGSTSNYVKQQPTPLTYLYEGDFCVQRGWLKELPLGLTESAKARFFAIEFTYAINTPTKNSDNTIVIYKVYPYTVLSLPAGSKVYDSFNYQSGILTARASDGIAVPEPEIKETTDKGVTSVFPNPANEKVSIYYTVKSDANVSISIYDARGLESSIVFRNRHHSKGAHGIQVDLSKNKLENGLYFVKIQIGNELVTEKLLVKR